MLAILPTPVLGGLVLFVGLNLLYDWLVTNRSDPCPGWTTATVLVVSLIIGIFGFLEGVAVGMAAAVIFFVMRFSKVSVIDAAFTGRELRSKKTRSATHRAILRNQGERLRVLRLRGYIIFGNAAAIGGWIKQALKDDPPPHCLLLDFAAVSGFDSSAANVMSRAIRAAHGRGTRVVLSAAPAHVRTILQRGLPPPLWQALIMEEDLDRALERCEDQVIAEWDRLHGDSDAARAALFGLTIDQAMQEVDRLARFEELAERLAPWLEARAFETDATIVTQGEEQEGMLLVIEGQSGRTRGGLRRTDGRARPRRCACRRSSVRPPRAKGLGGGGDALPHRPDDACRPPSVGARRPRARRRAGQVPDRDEFGDPDDARLGRLLRPAGSSALRGQASGSR